MERKHSVKLGGSEADHSPWESGQWSLLSKSLSFTVYVYLHVQVLTLTGLQLQQLGVSSEPVIPKLKIISCSLTRTGIICGDNGTKK